MRVRLALVLACAIAFVGRASAEVETADVQRVAAFIAYVGADYPNAVVDGKIAAQAEYDEQRNLLAEAQKGAALIKSKSGRAGAERELAERVAQVLAHVEARHTDAEVQVAARAATRLLIDDFGLVLAPKSAPDLPRAKKLFGDLCARCHGLDGRADTEEARKLEPRPVALVDESRMTRIAPSLAYHALTFGVVNTGMASFDSLPASDRWSLAFYAVGFRHFAAKDKRAPKKIFTRKDLAELTDGELLKSIDAAELAYVRTQTAFAQEIGGPYAVARRLMQELVEKLDDKVRAKELAIAIYLEGIEPHEAELRARDRAFADRVENNFIELRRLVESGASRSDVATFVTRSGALLDEAEGQRQSSGGARVAFFAAFAIALREGFEMSLLLAALLAFVRKSGHGEQAKWVHAGWLAAVPAGIVTWFLVGQALGGARRELSEGILTLFAAAMLLFVSHFVIGRLESRKWLKFLERRTKEGAALPSPWPLVTMAFVAAYREAIEVVLFFRALVLDMPGQARAIAAGSVAGVGILTAAVWIFGRVGRRINPRPVMTVSSILLTVLAVSLVGQGIRALQVGGYVGISPLSIPTISLLGIYPSMQGLVVQAIVLLLVLLPVLATRGDKK